MKTPIAESARTICDLLTDMVRHAVMPVLNGSMALAILHGDSVRAKDALINENIKERRNETENQTLPIGNRRHTDIV